MGDKTETIIERVADLENPIIKVILMGFMLFVALVFIVLLLPLAGLVTLWKKMRPPSPATTTQES